MKSFTGRTTLLTTLAVAGVLTAGTAAIAANIGILNSTNDSSIGSLSASDDLLGSAPPSPSSTAVTEQISSPDAHTYVVDDAGTVAVAATGHGIELRSAEPNPGWALVSSHPDSRTLTVAFTQSGRSVLFAATLDANGMIVADVTDPTEVAGSPADTVGSTAPDDHDDDHDDDDHDDDDHDDDHLYEGADDDD